MRTFHHGLRGGHTTLFQPVHYRTGLPDSVAAGNERGPVGNPGHCRIHPLIEERNNGVIPFNDLPDIKPYPVLLLQDKQRINHLIKAVHAALRRADAVLVNATIFDRLISTELSGMVSIRSQFFHRSSLPPVITRLCL